MSTEWTWDADVNQYRRWSEEEGCWILENGVQWRDQRSNTSPHDSTFYKPSPPANRSRPSTVPPPQAGSINSAASRSRHIAYNNGPDLYPAPYQDPPPEPPLYNAYDINYLEPGPLDFDQPNFSGPNPYGGPQTPYSELPIDIRQLSLTSQPSLPYTTAPPSARSITDPLSTAQRPPPSRRAVRNAGGQQPLDPRFRVVTPSKVRNYFKPGRVFKVLWPENLAGDARAGSSAMSSVVGPHEEAFAVKVRWFAVVKAHHSHCLCVTISTHGGKGTTKRGVNSNDYAVLVPEGEEPKLLAGERVRNPTLHIRVEDKDTKIEPSSRVDFSRVYTVEYNVKVFTVGRIINADLKLVAEMFRRIALKEPPESSRLETQTQPDPTEDAADTPQDDLGDADSTFYEDEDYDVVEEPSTTRRPKR